MHIIMRFLVALFGIRPFSAVFWEGQKLSTFTQHPSLVLKLSELKWDFMQSVKITLVSINQTAIITRKFGRFSFDSIKPEGMRSHIHRMLTGMSGWVNIEIVYFQEWAVKSRLILSAPISAVSYANGVLTIQNPAVIALTLTGPRARMDKMAVENWTTLPRVIPQVPFYHKLDLTRKEDASNVPTPGAQPAAPANVIVTPPAAETSVDPDAGSYLTHIIKNPATPAPGVDDMADPEMEIAGYGDPQPTATTPAAGT